jgi:hypothetical protein
VKAAFAALPTGMLSAAACHLPVVPHRGWYCEIPLISEGVYLQIEQAESLGQ